MDTVYKYETPIKDKFSIELPKGAEILSYQNQYGKPCIWAKVNSENYIENRNFRLIETGHPINRDENLKFIGTIQMEKGMFILHLFEII